MMRIEQFITSRADAPAYAKARREFLTNDPPTSSMLVSYALEIPNAKAIVDGIALEKAGPWKKTTFSTDKIPVNAWAGYATAQRAGPLVFLPGSTASDFETGLHPEARANHAFWFDRDVIKQTDFILGTRQIVLEEMGLSLNDAVQATVYLTNITDLPEFEDTWHRHFSNGGPAVTIVPVDELAVQGSVVEISVIALDPSSGLSRRVVETSQAPPPAFRGPQAVQGGPYLFIAGLTASNDGGLAEEADVAPEMPYYASPAKLQARYILDNVTRICTAAWGSLESLVKCQAYLTDVHDLVAYFEVWKEFFPHRPSSLHRPSVPSLHSSSRAAESFSHGPHISHK